MILDHIQRRAIAWERIGVAVLPGILLVLQFSATSEKQLWIVFLLILATGAYFVRKSYKDDPFTTSLYIPYIGVLSLEFWILFGWWTNPHSSLLMVRIFLIFLCMPSLIILYKLRSGASKINWLALIAFTILILIAYYFATGDWWTSSLNIFECLIYITPLLAFNLFGSLKFRIPVALITAAFEPFWINYNLDPLGSISHAFVTNLNPHITWAPFFFQAFPVVGFLIVIPIFIFRLSTRRASSWMQLVVSLLIIIPIVLIRYMVLSEPGVQYLYSVWIIILIHILMLWLPFWLLFSFRATKKVPKFS